MRIFLLPLCFLCVSPVHSIFDGACPRKDPPPGMVVVTLGSNLVLTCSGHVTVDGVKVNLTRNSSSTNKKRSSSDATQTTQNIVTNSTVSVQNDENYMKNTASEVYHSHPMEAGGSTAPGENRSLGYADGAYTASPHMVQPTSTSGPLKGESEWEAEEKDTEGDYEDEEGEEGSRVTRGIKSRTHWKWSKRAVRKGDGDWGEMSFERSGATLSLASVRLTDSGKYACHHRGREKFSVKVIVADPPESPTLFCYKKSPSSKIRCEWAPQKPVINPTNCYLSLSKSPREKFSRFPCSYSSLHSRCWCTLDYNEDELRTLYMVFLCVTSITGNATSTLLHITPLGILKPDPPSNVSVQQEEGQPTRMRITWNLPTSWKQKDSHYALIYEIKYRPVKSSFDNEQTRIIEGRRYYMITDAIPGVEYVIHLRAKDEYDGHWSEWIRPVYARSWTVEVPLIDDLTTTVFDLTDQTEGSGSGTDSGPSDTAPKPPEGPHHALWIVGLFALLSVVLAAYIFSHKNRFMSKLQNLSIITQCGDLSEPRPTAPVAPEGQALVTFAPPCYKQRPPSDAEEEEEQTAQERAESVHFNNTSYFFLPRE